MRWNHGIGGLGLTAVAVLIMSCSGDSNGPAPTPTAIGVSSGGTQSGTVGAALGTPIGVRVVDAGGDGVSGVAVTFAVTAGGGAVAATTPITTDAQGVASTTWTIGTVSGVSNNTATATAAGLSGSPVTFTASGNAGAPVAVVAVSGNNQNALFFQLAAAPLVARVNDAYGNPVIGATVDWSISGGGSMSAGTGPTDALGQTSVTRTIGGTMSGYLTTASLPGGGAALVNFVTLGTAVPSTYNIDLQFLTSLTATQLTAFTSAAARWSSIVIGDLPADLVQAPAASCQPNTPAIDQSVDDLMIYVTIGPIDGPGGILGSAGPCYVRLPGYLTLVGTMTFDVTDMAQLETQGILNSVILHEMGHVLGIGTLWTYVTPSLLTNAGLADPYFNGATGITQFNNDGGALAYAGIPVPVENSGGPGTRDGHWRELVMGRELMTGYIGAAVLGNPLSNITIGSLSDLAYTVSYVTADPYTVSALLRAPGGVPDFELVERPTGPIHGIDAQGRITRVR